MPLSPASLSTGAVPFTRILWSRKACSSRRRESLSRKFASLLHFELRRLPLGVGSVAAFTDKRRRSFVVFFCASVMTTVCIDIRRAFDVSDAFGSFFFLCFR